MDEQSIKLVEKLRHAFDSFMWKGVMRHPEKQEMIDALDELLAICQSTDKIVR